MAGEAPKLPEAPNDVPAEPRPEPPPFPLTPVTSAKAALRASLIS